MNIYPSHFTCGDRTPFTYFLRHRLTGKMYYGMRTAKGCKPEDLWTTYYTTSKIVKQIIKVDGKDIFEHKVSRIFNSIHDCRNHETKFLTRLNAATNPNWYNQHNGGKNFSTAGRPLCESAKKKKSLYMSSKIWVTNSIIEKSIVTTELQSYIDIGFRRGRIPQSLETKQKRSKSMTGKYVSPLTRQRQSLAQRGKSKPPLKPEYCKQRSDARMGHFVSNETKKKQSEKMMGHVVTAETRRKISETRKQKFALNKKEVV